MANIKDVAKLAGVSVSTVSELLSISLASLFKVVKDLQKQVNIYKSISFDPCNVSIVIFLKPQSYASLTLS